MGSTGLLVIKNANRAFYRSNSFKPLLAKGRECLDIFDLFFFNDTRASSWIHGPPTYFYSSIFNARNNYFTKIFSQEKKE